jgi:hypothetical protein
LAAAVASAATVGVIVLNHAAHLALKATVVVTASKAVATVLKNAARLHPALKVVLKAAVISVPKVALSTVATALIHAITVRLAHRAVATMHAAAQAIASHRVAPRSSVQAISSLTMQAATQHPNARALKC